MNIFKLELGMAGEDIVTGFKGIITARSQYLNGCIRYQIENKPKKQGEESKEYWYDEDRIKVTSNKKITLQNKTKTPSTRGGPQSKTSI